MKKRVAGILLGAGVTAVLLTGCGGKSATEVANESAQTENAGNGEGENAENTEEGVLENQEQEETPAVPVGVLLSEDHSKEGSMDLLSFEKNLEEKNYLALIHSADQNAEVQLKQFEELVADGVTAFVIDPVDPYSFTEAFLTANETAPKKFKLISYNDLLMDTDQISYYVTFDCRSLGWQAADRIMKDFSLEKMEDGTDPVSIEFFMGSLDDVDALFFYNGMLEKLHPYMESGKLVVKSGKVSFQDTGILGLEETIVREKFSEMMSELYAEEAPDVIVTGFDGALYAIQELLEAEDYIPGAENWPYLCGVGCEAEAVRDIAEGRVQFSMFTDRRKLVQKCVDLVDICVSGESPEVDNYEQYDNGIKIIGTNLCEGQVIDKDNYQMLIDNGYYEEREVEPLDLVESLRPEPTGTPEPTAAPEEMSMEESAAISGTTETIEPSASSEENETAEPTVSPEGAETVEQTASPEVAETPDMGVVPETTGIPDMTVGAGASAIEDVTVASGVAETSDAIAAPEAIFTSEPENVITNETISEAQIGEEPTPEMLETTGSLELSETPDMSVTPSPTISPITTPVVENSERAVLKVVRRRQK